MVDERDTKERLIDAALEVLKRDGYAGTSARVIARAGDLNQALIFYHFGSVHGLLLAALDRTSEERLARYREAVGEASSLEDLFDVATRVYREDLEAGHMTIVSEMIAGSMAHPELKQEIVTRLEPWVELAQDAIGRALGSSPFREALPERPLAYGLVAFYTGLNMLANLDPDSTEIEALLEAGSRLAPFAGAILQAG